MKKLNICVLSPKIYPCEIGGMEIFNYYFIKTLSTGYNVLVLTNCDDLKETRYIKINEKNSSILSIYINIFLKLLKFRKTDLLIVPYTSNSPLIYPVFLIQLLFKIPYILVIHGGGMRPWKPVFFQKKIFERANDIIAVSEPIKREYERRTNKSIKFIPPLIPFEIGTSSKDELRIDYGFNSDDKLIICVGSIKRIKGNDALLEAFIKLGSDYIEKQKIKLIFVGDGPLRDQLEEKANYNHMNGYIKFMGKIPHNKIKEIYKIADIYVIPSLFEGTPLSLLEAMFNELPVIGSNVKGINSIIFHKKNGLLFESENKTDLKNKIKYLIENPKSARNLGLNASNDYQSNYKFESMISQYIQIFHDIKEVKR